MLHTDATQCTQQTMMEGSHKQKSMVSGFGNIVYLQHQCIPIQNPTLFSAEEAH